MIAKNICCRAPCTIDTTVPKRRLRTPPHERPTRCRAALTHASRRALKASDSIRSRRSQRAV
eukprot:1942589-Prymnesium_polylepis.1